MITDKERQILSAIENYYKANGFTPTIRELCIILNYKSTKTVFKYIKNLRNKNYLRYTDNKKRTIAINSNTHSKMVVVNAKTPINIEINSNMIIYQIKNDFFNHYLIKKNDYLIIDSSKKIKNNDIGLFIIENKYRVMKYTYLDGYYILEDNKKEILNKITLIGIVVGVYRKNII